MSQVLTVDELTFEVRQSPGRRTLGMTLGRDGELTLSAPLGVSKDVLADFVREKRFWLYTKIAEREARQQPISGKDFVSGEGFPYLGRSYRLLLTNDQDVALKLEAGRFRLRRAEAAQGRDHFIHWYTERGGRWLKRRLQGWASRMDAEPTSVEVRDLGFRWGSCGKSDAVNFHWATMLLSPSEVDYVIVHELAHLIEPNHTPEFWSRVGRTLPEFEQRKAWLAEHGGRQVAL